MGIFDFGDKPTTTTSSTAPQYAEELKPYLKEITEARKKLYEQRLGEGYQYYPGQTIAGLTSEEVAAQQGIKGLMGSQAPLQQEALNLQRGTTREFVPKTTEEYMSPYLRTALDAQKAESQRQYERTAVPQFEADAVRAGGMSGLGSRAGVEAAERGTGQNRLLASIEAEGQQKAYEAAQKAKAEDRAAFRDQTARERQASAGIGKLSGDIFRGGTQELGLLQSIGEQKRDMSQSALDEAYLRYMQQQQYPEQQLNRYQSAIYGNPLNQQPSYTKTGTEAGGGPELGKTILGIGSALIPKFFAGGGGISSTMKGQMYNRNMGGPVMPPVMYRQQAGTVIPTGTLTRDDEGKVVAPPLVNAKKQQDFDAQYASDMEKGGETPYGLSGLDSATDGSAFAQTLTSPTSAPPVDTADNAITLIGGVVDINLKNLRKSVANQYLANKEVSNKNIKSLNREADAFEKKSMARYDKYKSLVDSLTGEDPDAKRKFWFTVSAAIMKPGNAFANMAQGLKEATLAASGDREKKNKLLMQLGKDEMDFYKDLDKLKYKSNIAGITLTAAQEKELNNMPQAQRDEAIKMLKAGESFNATRTALLKATGLSSDRNRKLASLDGTTRTNLMKRAAVRFGFTLNDQGDFQGTGNQKLREEQVKPALELYYAMVKAYGSTPDRVKGQRLADKVLQESLGKIGTGNSSSSKKSKPPVPVGTVPVR